MKEAIVETAGQVWQFLGKNGESDVTALARRLKAKKDVVLQSLGWLACEDKVVFSKKKSKAYVALTADETDIFNRVTENMQKADQDKKTSGKRAKAK